MARMSVFKPFSWSSLIFTNPLALSDLANEANVVETPTIVLLLSSFFSEFLQQSDFSGQAFNVFSKKGCFCVPSKSVQQLC